MTRLVRHHPTLAIHSLPHSLPRLVLAVLVALLLATSAADAALTTNACLVSKRKAWITFRKCQGTAQVNQIKGKLGDLAKCQTTFQTALTKINDKATKAVIPCRYRDNGDGTVTDYDTGLMWEQKTLGLGGICFFVPLGEISHCVNDTFSWADAQGFVSGASTDGTTVPSFLAGYADWRLPTIAELRTILRAGSCGTNPCIDPIFGPTVAFFYWSATTDAASPDEAWLVGFDSRTVFTGPKSMSGFVRAVRAGL